MLQPQSTVPGRRTTEGIPETDPLVGRQVGRYLLLKAIARGGMAQIYLARQSGAAGVSRTVVVKRIRPSLAQERKFIELFVNEARIAACLSHGNITQVFEVGELDGGTFLAMERVNGPSLASLLARAKAKGFGTLPEPLALCIAIEVCRGLHYAHTRCDDRGVPLNIVHRDVSPQNVLVSFEGQVKLTDFGIACARHVQRLDDPGAVMGKYHYFSPEQARGDALDARTDVFAVGVVLYEMLCGQLPWDGHLVQVARRILEGDFPRPRALNPSLSIGLERLMLAALAPNPKERFHSAQALQDALTSHLSLYVPLPSSDALSAFMARLYPEDLTPQERTARRPTLERLLKAWTPSAWPPPARRTGPRFTASSARTEVEKGSGRDRSLTCRLPVPRRRFRWAAALLAGFGLSLGALVMPQASVLVVAPTEAQVRVDDEPWHEGATVRIRGLSPFRRHLVQVRTPASKTWRQWVQPSWAEELVVEPELQPLVID